MAKMLYIQINKIVVKKFCLFPVSLLFLISGCSVTMQYTAALDKDGKIIKDPLVNQKVSYSHFEDILLELSNEFIYQDVELYINPTKQCTQWMFGFIEISDKVSCPLSLHVGNQYMIFMEIKNISSRPISFYADKILLAKKVEILEFDLECTNQIHHFDKDKQIYLKNGKQQATLMPGEYIEIKLTIGDWSKIGDRFQINLTEALSTSEIIKIEMGRFTAHKFGLPVH